MIAELTKRAAEMGEPGASPLDYAVEWVASGKTVLDLAASLSAATGFDFLRESVSRYLHTFPEAEQRLERARRRGAHGLVDQAVEIVDATEGEESREAIASAKLRADTRLWVAERWDRDGLGQKPSATVNLTINTLHIDALRRRATVALDAPDTPALPAVDAEDVTIESAE